MFDVLYFDSELHVGVEAIHSFVGNRCLLLAVQARLRPNADGVEKIKAPQSAILKH